MEHPFLDRGEEWERKLNVQNENMQQKQLQQQTFFSVKTHTN